MNKLLINLAVVGSVMFSGVAMADYASNKREIRSAIVDIVSTTNENMPMRLDNITIGTGIVVIGDTIISNADIEIDKLKLKLKTKLPAMSELEAIMYKQLHNGKCYNNGIFNAMKDYGFGYKYKYYRHDNSRFMFGVQLNYKSCVEFMKGED